MQGAEIRTSRKILRLMQRMTNFPALNEICRNNESGLLMQAAFCVRGLRLQASFACSFPLALFFAANNFPALYADTDNFSRT